MISVKCCTLHCCMSKITRWKCVFVPQLTVHQDLPWTTPAPFHSFAFIALSLPAPLCVQHFTTPPSPCHWHYTFHFRPSPLSAFLPEDAFVPQVHTSSPLSIRLSCFHFLLLSFLFSIPLSTTSLSTTSCFRCSHSFHHITKEEWKLIHTRYMCHISLFSCQLITYWCFVRAFCVSSRPFGIKYLCTINVKTYKVGGQG